MKQMHSLLEKYILWCWLECDSRVLTHFYVVIIWISQLSASANNLIFLHRKSFFISFLVFHTFRISSYRLYQFVRHIATHYLNFREHWDLGDNNLFSFQMREANQLVEAIFHLMLRGYTLVIAHKFQEILKTSSHILLDLLFPRARKLD